MKPSSPVRYLSLQLRLLPITNHNLNMDHNNNKHTMDIINIDDSSSDDDSTNHQQRGGKSSSIPKNNRNKKYTNSDSSSDGSDDEESEADIDDYLEQMKKRREEARAAGEVGVDKTDKSGGANKKKRKKQVVHKNTDDDSSVDSLDDILNGTLPPKKSTKKQRGSVSAAASKSAGNITSDLDTDDEIEMIEMAAASSKKKSSKATGKKRKASSSTTEETKKKKKKKKKDPNAPKNPRSAYTYFTMAIRPTIKEENPEADFGELAKLMSAKWKEIEDKDEYEQQAKDDKVRYNNEMKDYTPPPQDDEDEDEDEGGNVGKKPKAKRAKKDTSPLPITNRLRGPIDFPRNNSMDLTSSEDENWKIMMLMDLREFGQRTNGTELLNNVENHINQHFNGKYCEQVSLPVADYMFVARKYNDEGEVEDERILPLLIERKNVNDLQSCLITDSKKYAPLGFYEAQMYKFQCCGSIKHKIFLIEGDEDNPHEFSNKNTSSFGVVSPEEYVKRLKRVKTARMQLERGEWKGIKCISTKSKQDTISFLIQQLTNIKQSSFVNPENLSDCLTMKVFKQKVKEQMNGETFQEYLRLISQKGIGPVKAMKTIRDPELDWDKNFDPPSTIIKRTKSTLEDKPVFWNETSSEATTRQMVNAQKSNTSPSSMMSSYQDDLIGIGHEPFASMGNTGNNRQGQSSSSAAAASSGGGGGGIRLGGKATSASAAKDPRKAALAAAERRLQSQRTAPPARESTEKNGSNELVVLDSDDDMDVDVDDDGVIVID